MATQDRPLASATGGGAAAAVAADVADPGDIPIKARSFWEQVWRRFRRDRVALASVVVIILMLLAAYVAAPVASHILGRGPNSINLNANAYQPEGPWTYITSASGHGKSLYILGTADPTGRDEFLRMLYGAQVSLEVGVFSTVVGMLVGVALGLLAGFYGGIVDTLVSRATEIVMAFPLLLFVIALASTVGPRLNSYTLFGAFEPGVMMLTIVIAAFSWYYPARVVRAEVLSLREKEFVEAARMVGAGDLRIMRKHLIPHLTGVVVVLTTLSIATNILLEAGLSYLGVGIPLPTASWGNLISDAVQYYTTQPWLIIWPGVAILIATLCFNLLGDGLRDAIDPRATR